MIRINVNKSLNNFNEIDSLKIELDKIFIQYKSDKYGIIITTNEDELLSVMALFVGKPIVFSII